MELLRFTPVPSRERHDGWSVADQRKFIGRLARGHSVEEAARSLGHSRQSAYALKRRHGAEEFARAWIWAQRMGRHAAGTPGLRVDTQCPKAWLPVRRSSGLASCPEILWLGMV
jgi:hypothetical protein